MMIGMPNPWVDCSNLNQAEKIAGFDFHLKLHDNIIRAMKNMIEIVYQIDNSRKIVIRKSLETTNKDISGVYDKYSVNKTIRLSNENEITIRGEKDKIFVANIISSDKVFSVFCKQGISPKELKKIYKLIAESEK